VPTRRHRTGAGLCHPINSRRRKLNARLTYARALLGIATLGILLVVAPIMCRAQIVAPSQVTPQSLRPDSGSRDQGIALSGQPALTPPIGAENLDILVGDVRVDGAFSELASLTAAKVREINGKRVSVAQIYAFAQSIEQIYAQAGYTLARVVVPPQKLVDQGTLVIVVVDGFIEGIDVTGVPERVRRVVVARLGFLIGLRRLKRAAIERGLLVAGDVPGLKLRSTLMRGVSDGGARLVLEGEHDLVTGSLGADDRLSRSLGTWQLRGSVAVNNALGFGEQIYGTAGSGADLRAAVAGVSPLAVYGGGAVIPLGTDGLTLNPEYTYSKTQTPQAPGVPASLGTFERFALRLRDPVVWTRSSSLNINLSVEYVTQEVLAPAFGVPLNNDRYGVVRAGPDYAMSLPWGAGLQLGAVLSQGLGGRTEADAIASGVPLSRAGAGPDFTKITGNVRLSQPLLADLRLDLIGFGQLSAGKPMLRSEQFQLDGTEAVSAFAAGTFNVDQGATLRGELVRPFAARFDAVAATVSPYLFGSIGRGWLFDVTAVEQSTINAGAVGFGARSTVDVAAGLPGLSFGLELARQFTDVAGLRQGWRGNVNAMVTF
jgi:hemolysin activation/secretion protein